MKKGISLCGGGSKGSYELGAWDALRELKMDFDIVTGTSIGALNGMMMVQDDFHNCERLWQTVNIKSVIGNGIDFEELNVKGIFMNDEFLPFVKQLFLDKGTDIQPFKNMLKAYLNAEKIRNGKKEFGVVVTQFPRMIKEEVHLNSLDDADIYNYILSSASCFPAFPICKFNDKQYIDGGYIDNLPINLAFKLGATNVLAIDLNHNITQKEYLNNPFVEYIYPKWDLGSMLHFDQEVINKNRMLGYYDVMKHYGKFAGFKYTFKNIKVNTNKANLISMNVINDSIFLNNNKIINTNKKDIINVYSYLNKHINCKVTPNDYYIKCIEEIASIYEIDPCNVYTYDSLIQVIKEEITNSVDNSFKLEYDLLTTNKKEDFLLKQNKKKVISLLCSVGYSYEFKIKTLQDDIPLYLSLLFIENILN